MPKLGLISLGCAKNLVDSEHMLSLMRDAGWEITEDMSEADVGVVNTCGFINEAVEESLQAISEALEENGRVIVCGCLGGKAEEDGSNFIAKRMPKVLGVTGPDSVDEVLAMVEKALPRPHDPWDELVPKCGVRLTPKHYAYLKISEGCNHHCTYCIIPKLRGELVSRPIGDIVREAANLREAGVKELLVISQDTAAYGVDKNYKLDFAGGRPVQSRACNSLRPLPRTRPTRYVDAPALRLPVSERRRSGAAHGRGIDPALSRRAFPARSPAHSEAHEASGLD